MPITVLQHALSAELVLRLRDKDTGPQDFRALTRRLSSILASEAARHLPTRAASVETPLEPVTGTVLAGELAVVPVLRAGLGMLEAVLDLLGDATVGYVGMERDEETAVARTYYHKLPGIEGRTVILLDPMLATGGSACRAAGAIYRAGAARIILLCIVAAPEGVDRLLREHPDLQIIAAAYDRELNSKKYILPGLGDFGDRLYGTF
ncbi:MAG TPA: uracil phosphoribosyltransferase [Chthonomonadales bacterium]|nr:uracil phosphoribosyltransferase [Chthonomonadales bacterium]